MTREVFSWIDTTGKETFLSGTANIEMYVGPKGRFMPPIDLVEQQVPFQAGSRLKQLNVRSREIDLPLEIMGISTSDLKTQIRNLLNLFNPMLGDGQLKCVAEDGSQRLINCRYQSGLEIEESGLTWQKAIVVLKAFDPYWYDVNSIVQTFTTGQPATFFPMFPMRLTNSTVFADTTITNIGDVETYPTWILKGPGSGIFLRNLTTGDLININYSLGIGESISIDTRFGAKTVTKQDGTNLYSYLSSDSSLWALQKGGNEVRIEMQGATIQSSVQLTYQNRYWSA